jgi:hypothetical protein
MFLQTVPWPFLLTCVAYALNLINSISRFNVVAVIQGDIPLQGDFSAEHMIFGGGFSNMIFFVIKCNCIPIFQFLNIMQKKADHTISRGLSINPY